MKVYKHLRKDLIFLNVPLSDKDEVLRFAADAFASAGVVPKAQTLFDGMKLREQTMSTGIGKGIGIPHTASLEAENPAVLLIKLSKPIHFESLDGSLVDIVLALVVPESQTSLHLQILAGISRLCERTEFPNLVRQAEQPGDLLQRIQQLEQEIAFH